MFWGIILTICDLYICIFFESDFELFSTSNKVVKDLEEYATGRMGLTGIAVGIYDDKIACSLICMLMSMFLYSAKLIPIKLRVISFCISVLALFLTTQRTGLLCLLLFIVVDYFQKSKKRKSD